MNYISELRRAEQTFRNWIHAFAMDPKLRNEKLVEALDSFHELLEGMFKDMITNPSLSELEEFFTSNEPTEVLIMETEADWNWIKDAIENRNWWFSGWKEVDFKSHIILNKKPEEHFKNNRQAVILNDNTNSFDKLIEDGWNTENINHCSKECKIANMKKQTSDVIISGIKHDFTKIKKSKENDPVNPNHYNGDECYQWIKAVLTREQFIGWLIGQMMRYLYRKGQKDGNPLEQDQAKCRWYAERLMEIINE